MVTSFGPERYRGFFSHVVYPKKKQADDGCAFRIQILLYLHACMHREDRVISSYPRSG